MSVHQMSPPLPGEEETLNRPKEEAETLRDIIDRMTSETPEDLDALELKFFAEKYDIPECGTPEEFFRRLQELADEIEEGKEPARTDI